MSVVDLRSCWCRPLDTTISSLLEAALSGNEEQKPFECTLHPDMSILVDLALGSSKEPVNSLWINMQDYALSKGALCPALPSEGGLRADCSLFSCRLGQRVPQ